MVVPIILVGVNLLFHAALYWHLRRETGEDPSGQLFLGIFMLVIASVSTTYILI